MCVYTQVPLPVVTEFCDTLRNEGLPGYSRIRIRSLPSSGTTVTHEKMRLLMFQVRLGRKGFADVIEEPFVRLKYGVPLKG